MSQQLCIIADPAFANHLTGWGHPEQPKRYTTILQALQNNGLFPSHRPMPANDQEIRLCHTSEYIETVKAEVENVKNAHLPDDGSIWLSTGDVSICSQSLAVARLAVGAALQAVDQLQTRQAQKAFCPVRPPGHHAFPNIGKGFCLFNNVAIAARYAQKKYGIERILIADWDVHHGDGTQAIFEEDPSVFYFSTHRYGHGFYPGTGSAQEKGVGNILNCPIDIEGTLSPRKQILKAFSSKLPEAMQQFRPQLVFISAGFDAHEKDPLGGFDLTDEDFATLTKIVKEIANQYAGGQLVSVLEGGYSLQGLASSVSAHIQELSKD